MEMAACQGAQFAGQFVKLLLLALGLTASLNLSVAHKEHGASSQNGGPKPCLECLPELGGQLNTAFRAPPTGMSRKHTPFHQPLSYPIHTFHSQPSKGRARRDTEALKKLLGVIPEEEWTAEKNKLAQEIDTVREAEDILESDLDQLKHAKHTRKQSTDRQLLEVEIEAMQELESELYEQEELIKDTLEASHTDHTQDSEYTEDYGSFDYSEQDSSNERKRFSEDSDLSETEDDYTEYTSSQSDGESSSENSSEFSDEQSKDYEYSDESQDYSDESQEYSDESQEYSDESQEYSDESQDYSDESQEYSDESQDYSDENQDYSDENQEYSDESQEYSDDYIEEIEKYLSSREKRELNWAPSWKRRHHTSPTTQPAEHTKLVERIKSVEATQKEVEQQIKSLEKQLLDSLTTSPSPTPEQPTMTIPSESHHKHTSHSHKGTHTSTEHKEPAHHHETEHNKEPKHHSPTAHQNKQSVLHHQKPAHHGEQAHHAKTVHHAANHNRPTHHGEQAQHDGVKPTQQPVHLKHSWPGEELKSLINKLADTGNVKVHSGRDKRVTEGLTLEQRVLEGVQRAKSEGGLNEREAMSLLHDAESLEHKESDIVDQLLKDPHAEDKLDDIERRIVLEQLLQDLRSSLENQLSHKKIRTHRSTQSVVDNARFRRYASWVSALEKQRDVTFEPVLSPSDNGVTYHYRNGESRESLREKRAAHKHHKGHRAHHHQSHSTEGHKDMDRCERCEAMIGEEVCGRNGKTYNSLCHAVNCAGLTEDDITVGSCDLDDVCTNVECEEGSECVALTNGVCLTIYSAQKHKRLTCRQYMCVSEGQCTSNANSQVCGVDGKSYPSLCYLHKADVQLAYSGMCRPQLCTGTVCGRDGVTYTSSCHARAHGVKVDYPGDCFAESEYPEFHSCDEVVRAGRCPKLVCDGPVLPKDSCCPVCGGALVVHPDTKAMVALVSTWKDINHMYIIENFLRKLLSSTATKSCELSATLTNAGNISVVLEAINSKDSRVCQSSAMTLAKAINGHYPAVEDSMLRPMAKTAALMDAFNPLEKINSFMEDTQNKVVNGVKGKVRDGIQYADSETSRLEDQHAYNSSASLQGMTLMGLLALYYIVQYII